MSMKKEQVNIQILLHIKILKDKTNRHILRIKK